MICALLAATCLTSLQASEGAHRGPTLKRLEPAALLRLHQDVRSLEAARRPVSLKTGRGDLRCIIHAHSYLSHDSRGTIEEIAQAAKLAGVDAVFLTNHPKKDEDVVAVGQRESVDGVLFVPGAETNGFLAFPGKGKLPRLDVGEQDFVRSVSSSGGLVFVAHPEEHKDWSLTGLTGTEVYNTHADLKDEAELLKALQPRDGPGYLLLLRILDAVRDYPQEVFASLFDPPLDNLARYDRLSIERPYAAIAGNDSHQNTGFVLIGQDAGKISVQDPLGEQITLLDTKKTPLLVNLFGKPEPGKEMLRRVFDPYAVSFRYVSTHVLAKKRTVASIEQALREGRTYVAFDWMGDPTGTAFVAKRGSRAWTIGDKVRIGPELMLEGETSLPASLRIMKDGAQAASAEGRTISFKPTGPGVYRLEASLNVGGEQRSWIYTGAIRITQ